MSRDERVIDKQGHKFIKIKSGRLITFLDALGEANRARATMLWISRAFKLAAAADLEREADDLLRGYDMKLLEWLIDDLESYVYAMRHAIMKHQVAMAKKDKITHLRNTTGRTEAEADLYRRKADELEAQS